MPVGPSENPKDETTEGLLLQIRNAPKDAEPYNRLGLRYAAGGRIQEALLAFQRAAELWGTDVKAASPRCNLGAILFSQHRFGDGLKQYKLALQADPSSALAHYGAGSCYETLGESGLARGEYGACLAGEAKGPIADAARAAMERLAAAGGGARPTGPTGGTTPPAGGGR
jgi:tetratricopeptide (TPR) repeat protein